MFDARSSRNIGSPTGDPWDPPGPSSPAPFPRPPIGTRARPIARRHWRSSASIAAALGFTLLLCVPVLGSSATPTHALVAAATTTCNPKNPSPSAIDIPSSNPSRAKIGDLLNVSFEFRAANYTKAFQGTALSFPSITAVFPLTAGGSVKLYFAPKNLTIAGSGWSAPALRTVSGMLAFTPGFDVNKSAYLTTSKIAVMANVPTGTLTLQLRWHWTLFHQKTGLLQGSAWTVPSQNATLPYLPSSFYPAGWVGIASTSGASAPSGTNYTVGLNGAVSNTWFRMVLEFPKNGTEIQSIYENSTGAPALFNATLPLAFRNGTSIPTGGYLIHVHDSCQAIVHILSIQAT